MWILVVWLSAEVKLIAMFNVNFSKILLQCVVVDGIGKTSRGKGIHVLDFWQLKVARLQSWRVTQVVLAPGIC